MLSLSFLSLAASPPPRQTSWASTEAAAKLPFTQPDWTIGYYAWIWAPEATRTKGALDSTLGVQFTVNCPPSTRGLLRPWLTRPNGSLTRGSCMPHA